MKYIGEKWIIVLEGCISMHLTNVLEGCIYQYIRLVYWRDVSLNLLFYGILSVLDLHLCFPPHGGKIQYSTSTVIPKKPPFQLSKCNLNLFPIRSFERGRQHRTSLWRNTQSVFRCQRSTNHLRFCRGEIL